MSGKLTENYIKKQVGLGSLCQSDDSITYGVIKLGDEIDNGNPCLRTSNVRWLNIETNDVKKIEPSLSASYSRTILKGGEVLVNVRGTLGGVAVVPKYMSGWNVSREVAVVPLVSDEANSEFIALWIASSHGQKWLENVAKGVAYIGINLKDLRVLPIDLPPIEIQTEIVRRVEELFAFADQIEQRVKVAQQRVNHLTQAILAKAFRGELTAEWREQNPDLISGENSAAALLARIQAEQKLKQVLAKPTRRQPKSLELDTTDFKFDREEANQR